MKDFGFDLALREGTHEIPEGGATGGLSRFSQLPPKICCENIALRRLMEVSSFPSNENLSSHRLFTSPCAATVFFNDLTSCSSGMTLLSQAESDES